MRLNNPNQLKTTLNALCRQPGNIAILTHKNPDGDGLAASLALKKILHKLGHEADIILEEKAPEFLDFLDVDSQTLVYNSSMRYNHLILVDCHEPERTGKCSILAQTATSLIAIDHHEPQNLNPHWYYYLKPDVVSVGAILFNTYRSDIIKLNIRDKNYVTDCIYTTILNDTDGFMNNNTDATVFHLCAEIVKLGTQPASIMEKFLLNNSPQKLRFVGETLSSIETYNKDKILFMYSTISQLEDNDLIQDDTSKITKWVKGANGIEVFIYAREIDKNKYRLSLRSSKVNCNKICNTFDGGGHNSAAGCVINAPLEKVKELILSEVTKNLNE